MNDFQIINPFTDIPNLQPPPQPPANAGQTLIPFLRKLASGMGNKGMYFDPNTGLWLGNQKFANAPFSVDMNGVGVAHSWTLRDQNNTTIIDPVGLVSTASFVSGNVHDTTDRTNSLNGTYQDVPNTSLTFTLARSTTVIVFATATYVIRNMVASADCSGAYQVNIDGVNDGFPFSYDDVQMYTPSFSSNSSRTSIASYQNAYLLSTGSHTIKLQNEIAHVNSEVLHTLGSSVTYIVMGK